MLSSLMYPEFAGIFLWYTDKELTPGNFKGGQGVFNGIVSGMEFLGKNGDFVVGVNHGEIDFSKYRHTALFLDSPDPEFLKGHKRVTLKVIGTEKNFKIELYAEGKLIYDRMRYAAILLGDKGSGKCFGITTEYSKVGEGKGFILHSVKVNSREEKPGYNPAEVQTSVPLTAPRLPRDVPHSDEEIQYTIAGIEHLSKYLRVVLGDPEPKPIGHNVGYLKRTLNFQSAQIMDLRALLFHEMDEWRKREEADRKQADEMKQILKSLERTAAPSSRVGAYTLVPAGISLFVLGFAAGIRTTKIKRAVARDQ